MTAPPDDAATHDVSLAIWDVTTPVVAGRRATLKAGVACAFGCDLTGARIDVYGETGVRVGGGEALSTPWAGSAALYWAECDVTAPETEGDHWWNIRADAPGASHGHVVSRHQFIASKPPEHHVTLEVIDKQSGTPVGGVELRVGAFRAATDAAGIAHVEVPGGTYDVYAWKLGYELLSMSTPVDADRTIRLEVAAAPERERPYWM